MFVKTKGVNTKEHGPCCMDFINIILAITLSCGVNKFEQWVPINVFFVMIFLSQYKNLKTKNIFCRKKSYKAVKMKLVE